MSPTASDALDERAACPMHTACETSPRLAREDVLLFPKNRRSVLQYSTDDSGEAELHIYYGDKEISFDDPDLFAFGETLANQTRFAAGEAADWGQGYAWPRIHDLLLELLNEGVLIRAEDKHPGSVSVADQICSSPLTPSMCEEARSWDDCEAITRDLARRPIELGFLELIVPIFRVAHISLDADRRQVGEANVFPPAMRLNVPTEWRICNLPGTRYQSERPMNVTAMRVMRAHWPQMMAAILRVRQGYLRRFPEPDNAWTVGHVERLACAVLALPSFQLMRRRDRVESGDLHPALSSMFRVTDGVRMTMHQMLFVPVGEPARSPCQPVTIDEILDYAERNYSFHSSHGVCAGPKAMVRELLRVLLEGRGDADYGSIALEPAVQAALEDLEYALDYGLLGLRVYAAVFSLWPVMTRAYEQIATVVEAWPSPDTPLVTALRDGIVAHRDSLLKGTYLGNETWRNERERVYADMYRQCGHGLPGLAETPGLDVLLEPVWTDAHRRTASGLQDILRGRGAPETSEAFVLDLSAKVMDFLLRARAILRTACVAQNDINRLLGRELPQRPFTAADINVYNLMQGDDPERLPYLIDALESRLGVNISVDMDTISINERGAIA